MRIIRLAICLTALLTIAGNLFAQAGATGTILGTVTDGTGPVVTSAKVRVTNVATGVSVDTVTSSAGDFQTPALESGPYSVSAEARGFKKSISKGLTLAVDQKLRVNLALTP